VGSQLDGGISLGVGAGLFHPAGRGQWAMVFCNCFLLKKWVSSKNFVTMGRREVYSSVDTYIL
jgi:hypothetical protein